MKKIFTLLALVVGMFTITNCSTYDPIVAVDEDGNGLTASEADEFFGLGYARDKECMQFALDLANSTFDAGATDEQTGWVYVVAWNHKGNDYFTVMRELVDGGRQGPSVGMGYHTSKKVALFGDNKYYFDSKSKEVLVAKLEEVLKNYKK